MTPHHELLTSLNQLYYNHECDQAVVMFKKFINNSIPENEDKAEEIFLDVIAMTKLWDADEKESNCFLIKGLALQQLKKFDQAIEAFEYAIRLK